MGKDTRSKKRITDHTRGVAEKNAKRRNVAAGGGKDDPVPRPAPAKKK